MIACFVTSDDLELFIKAVRSVTLDNGFNLATKNAQRACLTAERLLKIRKSKGDYHKYNIQCNTATLVLQVYILNAVIHAVTFPLESHELAHHSYTQLLSTRMIDF